MATIVSSPNTELRMAELLCTRLCHDLAGPIGALNNGAEFLVEEGKDLQNQAVGLIVSSAQQAVSRLQFFRMAYGKINDHGEACMIESKKTAEAFFADSKIILDWPEVQAEGLDIPLSRKMVRLLFNLLIIAASGLIKGGTISVRIDRSPEGAKQIRVRSEGGAIKWEKEAEHALTGPASVEQITPKYIQLYLTRKLAEELNTALSLTSSDHHLEITAIQSCAATQTQSACA